MGGCATGTAISTCDSSAGRPKPSRSEAGRDDPLSLIGRVGYVIALLSEGRTDDAASESRRMMELAPDFPATYTLLAFDLPKASLDDALKYAERGFALADWSAGTTGLLAGLLHRAGDYARAAALIQPFADDTV
jgi:hypothetical protein